MTTGKHLCDKIRTKLNSLNRKQKKNKRKKNET